MADPIEDMVGDYRAFAAQQRDRLATRQGVDIARRAEPPRLPSPRVGPVPACSGAHRTPHGRQSREHLERPADLLDRSRRAPGNALDGKVVPLIELIAPVHQRRANSYFDTCSGARCGRLRTTIADW